VRVVFGECEFDSGRRLVLRHGRPISLSPRAFQLLALLLDRRPEAVSKAALLEQLWPETFVSDASLHNLIAELRAALDDTPGAARYIRTIPKYGYAFHGDARPVSALEGKASSTFTARSGPRLISTWGEWLLSEGPNLIGRDPDCPVRVDSPTVSRHHARIVVNAGDASVEDLRSKNGTYVNGRRVKQTVPVDDGGEIRVGSVTMRYRNTDDMESTLSQRGGNR
jgi:DNA-binding winged helix-turn-helix (wHTH) protein